AHHRGRLARRAPGVCHAPRRGRGPAPARPGAHTATQCPPGAPAPVARCHQGAAGLSGALALGSADPDDAVTSPRPPPRRDTARSPWTASRSGARVSGPPCRPGASKGSTPRRRPMSSTRPHTDILLAGLASSTVLAVVLVPPTPWLAPD